MPPIGLLTVGDSTPSGTFARGLGVPVFFGSIVGYTAYVWLLAHARSEWSRRMPT